jgi:hypothetical protein
MEQERDMAELAARVRNGSYVLPRTEAVASKLVSLFIAEADRLKRKPLTKAESGHLHDLREAARILMRVK